jgi:hypothetical protein
MAGLADTEQESTFAPSTVKESDRSPRASVESEVTAEIVAMGPVLVALTMLGLPSTNRLINTKIFQMRMIATLAILPVRGRSTSIPRYRYEAGWSRIIAQMARKPAGALDASA